MNLRAWLFETWPTPQKRGAVAQAYRALALNPLLMADIALRGGLFHPQSNVRTLYDAGVAEGRRQMALETIKLAELDPALLSQWFERKQPQETR